MTFVRKISNQEIERNNSQNKLGQRTLELHTSKITDQSDSNEELTTIQRTHKSLLFFMKTYYFFFLLFLPHSVDCSI